MRAGGRERAITNLPATAQIVIVGAGIAGLSLALELPRRGVHGIVVIDQGYPGSGATGRNIGRIRAMQLTEPLCEVARACAAKYERMSDELGFNILLHRLGYAWVLYEDDELRRMRDVVAMHHRIGIRSELLGARAVVELLPVFRGGEPITAAVVHDDAIVHHAAVVSACLAALATTSVTLVAHTAVIGITRAADAVRGVITSRGKIEASTVVNAAGGWSNHLNRLAGVSAPNRPLRREVLVSAPMEPFIARAVTFYRPMEGWFNQTLRGEVVMGVVDPKEPEGHQQCSSWDFLQRTATLMTRKAPALGRLSVIRQWAGMYDVTPDQLPLVGPTDQLGGWWQANGWSGRGMLLAPHLMERMAERWVGRPAALEMFDPDRFAAGSPADGPPIDYYARYSSQ